MRRECRERFPRHSLQRKPLVSDPDMHHGTCVTHVPWCMQGSLTRGGGETFPACATRNFTYLVRGPLSSHAFPVSSQLLCRGGQFATKLTLSLLCSFFIHCHCFTATTSHLHVKFCSQLICSDVTVYYPWGLALDQPMWEDIIGLPREKWINHSWN